MHEGFPYVRHHMCEAYPLLKMSLQEGQARFRAILADMDKEAMPDFLQWVQDTVDDAQSDLQHSNADNVLEEIQEDLRQILPLTTTLPSEHIIFPQIGQNSNLDAATTVHMDGFLYDDDIVDKLCDEGKMSRNYCKQCGSHQVAPLSFISHSTSIPQLKYIYQHLLPDLTGKTLVDVGSRTGAVLYGAYVYSSASSAVGVEINSDFCHLQQTVIDKYGMSDRLQVLCDDVCNQGELLSKADVIVMNNVFEFFVPVDVQQKIWQFLRETIRKPGGVVVLSPSLEESLAPLGMKFDPSTWLRSVDTAPQRAAAYKALFPRADSDADDLNDIHVYQVL